ncbi:MAG: hypothetical protein IJM79_02660 [Erysipelotrichaceae bacterium]|nr:hypothetical protein [Erysipelotrichaceae bacterium]
MNSENGNQYPTLKQIRSLREEHGPLIAVHWSTSSSGMMAGSYARSSLKLYRDNGEARLLHKDMKVYEPEYICLYVADEELFDELQRLSERENLPVWGLLKADPAQVLQVYDYSSSSSIELTYDDGQIGGDKPFTVFLNWEAVRQQNATDVWGEIVEIMRRGIDPQRLLDSRKEKNPYRNPFASLFNGKRDGDAEDKKTAAKSVCQKDGSWQCPECGAEGNTGKFCAECGSRRPE